MSRLKTFAFSALALFTLSLASCGGSELTGSSELSDASSDTYSAAGPGGFDPGPGFPEIPLDDEAGTEKSSSWVSSVDPTTPIASHRSWVCPTDTTCRVLQGLYDMPLTHVPPPPHFAYAFYEVPLGASEADLLEMALHGHTLAAGETFWVAVANYTAMHWQWFGPGATGEFALDFDSFAWDFTSPAGKMYFVVLVLPENTYHLEDITLKFKDDIGPIGGVTWWNVNGQAFVNVATGVGLPGANVRFEDLNTGVIYNTVADANGNWGMNLPTGDYNFRVWANTVLFDLPGYAAIETFDVNLTLAAGQFTYHGSNAAYDGTVIPMPLITTDVY